jgi:hypothetical protein
VRGNKNHAQTVTVAGERYGSKAEYARWCELQILERAGEIRNLTPHPKYLIQAKFKDRWKHHWREIAYTPDSRYEERQPDGTWRTVVEEVKGQMQPDSMMRLKLCAKKWPDQEWRIVWV